MFHSKKFFIFVFGILILAGLVMEVKSSFWFREKLVKFYHAKGHFSQEAKIYDQIFRRNQVATHCRSFFYRRSPASSYRINKELFDYYRSRDPRRSVAAYTELSGYDIIKNLCPQSFQGDVLSAKEPFLSCRDDFQNALVPQYLKSPYWRYRLEIDLLHNGRTVDAKKLFEGMVFDFPFVSPGSELSKRADLRKQIVRRVPFGIVGIWPLDDDKDFIAKDLSGRNNHGIIYGAKAVIDEGRKALQFNGQDDYVEITDEGDLQLSREELTVAFWVKILSWEDATIFHLVGKYFSSRDTRFLFSLGGRHDQKEIRIYTTIDQKWNKIAAKSFPLQLNQWYHIAWTYSPKGSVLYIDGIPQGATIKGGRLGAASGAPIKLGVGNFHGLLANVYIFNYALTKKEIKELRSRDNGGT